MMTSENICFSGGAAGADYAFGEAAKIVDHKVMHFSFVGHKTKAKDNVYPISDLDLLQADKYLIEANKLLKRGTFPYDSDYVNNMLRRNYFQIKDTERVYAVGYFDKALNGNVAGGTSWAVTMAALKGISEIYLFDQDKKIWWCFTGIENTGGKPNFLQWITAEHLKYEIPAPSGKYTGIGSRNLTETGIEAITELYAKCK